MELYESVDRFENIVIGKRQAYSECIAICRDAAERSISPIAKIEIGEIVELIQSLYET